MPRRNRRRNEAAPDGAHVLPPPTPVGLGARAGAQAERAPAFTPPRIPFDRLAIADRLALRRAVRLMRQGEGLRPSRERNAAVAVGYCDARGRPVPGLVLPPDSAVIQSHEARAAIAAAKRSAEAA